ncbi:branched-chain amino acid ABC transporter substrate-binding protein [Massilia glaciei]|uniref:Branched-chain amino acid ABC transporter substrate-binding protein n=1 Tax=Massilia glaciei TaxID=1524097 RepID=A0A2U2HG97_9BURK|nr:branched-chain amino acid ABC transporter substrate-binding protein [Massilia glaciei]
MINSLRPLTLAVSMALLATPFAAQAENVRIAFIDPLSGPFAPVGQNQLKSFQMIADIANKKKWAGEHTLEVVGFDNKGSPQESLTQLKAVIDQGYRYITQGSGSGAGLALLDQINKHNDRNPGKEIVYLNYAAIDPDMTNSKCSFWHFRFDAHSDMKMEALTTYMAGLKDIKKVYIIGQNYAFGQSVSKSGKAYLKRKRPDIEIVGDDLHPIGQVKDFSPYIAKIKASGADTVITGNWGSDLALLIRAAKDADLKADFYTYYAVTTGVPTAVGAAGEGRVKIVGNWTVNDGLRGRDIVDAFKLKYKDDYYTAQTHSALGMLANAMKAAKSTDPVKVAFALEGAKFQSLNGGVMMQKVDHQLQQSLFIATWSKKDGKSVVYDQENTGYGWKIDKKIDAYVAGQPTSCQMKRPSA